MFKISIGLMGCTLLAITPAASEDLAENPSLEDASARGVCSPAAIGEGGGADFSRSAEMRFASADSETISAAESFSEPQSACVWVCLAPNACYRICMV